MVSTYQHDSYRAATDILRNLVSVTTELFGGIVGIKESFDPEFREDTFVVLTVETDLAPDIAAARELDWIRKIEAIVPGWDGIRLSVRFK